MVDTVIDGAAGVILHFKIAPRAERQIAISIVEIPHHDLVVDHPERRLIPETLCFELAAAKPRNRGVKIGLAADLVSAQPDRPELLARGEQPDWTGFAAACTRDVERAARAVLFKDPRADVARRHRNVIERKRDHRPGVAHLQFLGGEVAREKSRALADQFLIRSRFDETTCWR